MKKKCRFLAVGAAFAVLLVPFTANAQRTFVERSGASVGVRYAGDWRAANSLDHLNRELGQARIFVHHGGSGRAGSRLARIARATDRLNHEYHSRLTRSYPIHVRAEALRAEVRAIRSGVPRYYGWR